jgi:preprotein translocase subunit SecF
VSVNEVGPSWGKAVTNKARTALIAFFIAITIYISFRFEWKMAIAAIVAVVHDILVTVGVYSLSRFEVTPATVVAFLTILGYSLYDTIVVFDRIEENTRGLSASGRMTYADTVNLSMNQVLMRSLNTSFVAILPVASVLGIGAYILGATALQDFGLALLVGLLTGAYSSIFIASPVLVFLKEREPRYAAIRQRLAGKTTQGTPLTPAAAAAMAGGGSGGGRSAARSADGGGDGSGGEEGTPPLTPGRPRTGPANRPHGRQGGRPRPRKKRRR